MEHVVFDQSPLAEYLKDEGEEQQQNWAQADSPSVSPPLSPSFAPRGRPVLKASFRNRLPPRLQLDTPSKGNAAFASIQQTYTRALTSRIDPADNSKFLEQFRYAIVASQLLSSQTILGQQPLASQRGSASQQNTAVSPQVSGSGILVAVIGACVVAWLTSWLLQGGYSSLNRKRVTFLLLLAAVAAILLYSYARRQQLRLLRVQALSEGSAFVATSQDFDSATGAAIALIQEVELVSRGYRLSTPLPPISRLEDHGQSRRCVRLRKALRVSFADLVPRYLQTLNVVKGFSEQLNLEKYYDVYDISDLDMSDALQGLPEVDDEEAESLRILRIVVARFHTLRKMYLCALLAFEVNGDESDLLRWHTALESLRMLTTATKDSYVRIASILSEEETFPQPPTPMLPLTPGKERWRSQLRNLNSLSTGIRGLQAKLHLIREESDRALNEADADISLLGSNLMSQYDSLGADLKMLMQAWEEGKAALASGIDKHEKRVSSMSAIMSPATSLSGLTTVEEGGALEALKALNGETPPPMDFSSQSEPDTEQVFEAIARPRPRSMLTREERIAKMKEDRERKETARQTMEANRGMLRELEMVINLRPRSRRSKPGRISL